MRACWCGNENLAPFNADYVECKACGTLVSLKSLTDEQLVVKDDETDFYGKQYWLDHQVQGLGIPAIQSRARIDLAERNLYWLNTLLKYRLPPAQIMELGCAHGSFVALMRQAGYSATGLELSPWVVEFGRKTFDVPILLGPLEAQEMPLESLDVIVLMDVLEHLSDPLETLKHSLQRLKPDGLLIVQTPQFKDGMCFDSLVEAKDRFVEMLIPDEHIYLFGERSVKQLFSRLGAGHVQFEPALFAHYDMFFVVSRQPIQTIDRTLGDLALQSSANGRIALALLDVSRREQERALELAKSEADRTARAKQIDVLNGMLAQVQASHTAQLEALTQVIRESEADRAARATQVETLTHMLNESEADRAARATQIETLTHMLNESEADRAARAVQIDTLTAMFTQADARRIANAQEIEALHSQLRLLLSRRAMRLMTKISEWPEVSRLHEKLGSSRG